MCLSGFIDEDSLNPHQDLVRRELSLCPHPIFQMGTLEYRDTERVNEQVTLPSSGRVRMRITGANARGPGR